MVAAIFMVISHIVTQPCLKTPLVLHVVLRNKYVLQSVLYANYCRLHVTHAILVLGAKVCMFHSTVFQQCPTSPLRTMIRAEYGIWNRACAPTRHWLNWRRVCGKLFRNVKRNRQPPRAANDFIHGPGWPS